MHREVLERELEASNQRLTAEQNQLDQANEKLKELKAKMVLVQNRFDKYMLWKRLACAMPRIEQGIYLCDGELLAEQACLFEALLDHSSHVPVLFDPSNSLTSYLTALCCDSQPIITSVKLQSYLSDVCSALRHGRPLILHHAELIGAELDEVLNLTQQMVDNQPTVDVDGTEIKISRGFRLYLFSSTEAPKLKSKNPRLKCFSIDFNSQVLSTLVRFMCLKAFKFSSSYVEAVQELQSKREIGAELLLIERTILDAIGEDNAAPSEQAVFEAIPVTQGLNLFNRLTEAESSLRLIYDSWLMEYATASTTVSKVIDYLEGLKQHSVSEFGFDPTRIALAAFSTVIFDGRASANYGTGLEKIKKFHIDYIREVYLRSYHLMQRSHRSWLGLGLLGLILGDQAKDLVGLLWAVVNSTESAEKSGLDSAAVDAVLCGRKKAMVRAILDEPVFGNLNSHISAHETAWVSFVTGNGETNPRRSIPRGWESEQYFETLPTEVLGFADKFLQTIVVAVFRGSTARIDSDLEDIVRQALLIDSLVPLTVSPAEIYQQSIFAHLHKPGTTQRPKPALDSSVFSKISRGWAPDAALINKNIGKLKAMVDQVLAQQVSVPTEADTPVKAAIRWQISVLVFGCTVIRQDLEAAQLQLLNRKSPALQAQLLLWCLEKNTVPARWAFIGNPLSLEDLGAWTASLQASASRLFGYDKREQPLAGYFNIADFSQGRQLLLATRPSLDSELSVELNWNDEDLNCIHLQDVLENKLRLRWEAPVSRNPDLQDYQKKTLYDCQFLPIAAITLRSE